MVFGEDEQQRMMMLLGQRVSVKFKEGWFLGRVAAFGFGRIEVHYDDGEIEELNFPDPDIKIVSEDEEGPAAAGQAVTNNSSTSAQEEEVSGDGDGLCEYERARLVRLAQNNAMLKSLGLEPKPKPPPYKLGRNKPRVKKPTAAPPQKPTRASGRACAAPERFVPPRWRVPVGLRAPQVGETIRITQGSHKGLRKKEKNGLSEEPVKHEGFLRSQLQSMDHLFLRMETLHQELHVTRTEAANLHKIHMEEGKKQKMDDDDEPCPQWIANPAMANAAVPGATPDMPRPGVPYVSATSGTAAGVMPRQYVPGSTPVTSTGLATGTQMRPNDFVPRQPYTYNPALPRLPMPDIRGVPPMQAQIDANARLTVAQAEVAAAQARLLTTQAAHEKALAVYTAAKAKADAIKPAQAKAAAAAKATQVSLAAGKQAATAGLKMATASMAATVAAGAKVATGEVPPPPTPAGMATLTTKP